MEETVGMMISPLAGGSMVDGNPCRFKRQPLLSPWVGWTTLVFSAGLLVLLLIMGDTLPAFHYMPPLLIGIVLLVA